VLESQKGAGHIKPSMRFIERPILVKVEKKIPSCKVKPFYQKRYLVTLQSASALPLGAPFFFFFFFFLQMTSTPLLQRKSLNSFIPSKPETSRHLAWPKNLIAYAPILDTYIQGTDNHQNAGKSTCGNSKEEAGRCLLVSARNSGQMPFHSNFEYEPGTSGPTGPS
jgi:hypothetical protein